MAMGYIPVEVDVADRPCVVIGADPEVVPRLKRLLAEGARVAVYACGAQAVPAIEKLAHDGRVVLHAGTPTAADLEASCIAVASSAQADACASLAAWTRKSGRLLCVHDRPELSTFANPASFVASGLGVRIFTSGKSPGLARRLREDLEVLLSDPRLGELLERLHALRTSLPRGTRAKRMAAALEGFGLRGRLSFPDWFERAAAPP
jgi:precorrin-2 dehydrogenase/sirohydrochlorin ferrochelatase